MKTITKVSNPTQYPACTRAAVPGAICRAPALTLLAGLCWCHLAMGQEQAPVSPVPVPYALKSNVAALGNRFVQGNERLVLSGTATHGSGTGTAFAATFETPRKVRYQEGSKTIVYNGSQMKGSSSVAASDDGMMESLLEDSLEGMVYLLPQARLVRPLMYRARLDNGKSQTYTGAYVDIIEIILPVPSQASGTVRQKHFYFDSTTGLLDRVIYLTGSDGATRAETRFQGWHSVNKVLVPGTITRLENGVNQFVFSISGASVGAAQADQTFQLP